MRATSADVARRAGVSRATVSYVLNNVPGRTLSPETRANVLRAAEELNYHPNSLAKSLKRGHSTTVLLPLRGLALNHVMSTILNACTEALRPHGLSLVLDLSKHDGATAQADAWDALAPAAVVDLVLPADDPSLAEIIRRGTVVIHASGAGDESWETAGDRFARDQRLLQLHHLADQGHRRIRWVLPPGLPDRVDPRVADRLVEAIERAAARRDVVVTFDRVPLADIGAAVATWDTLPDAVAAHNDTYAVAVITALASRGARVPEDVAVIGADDDPIGRAVTPALTTVGGDFQVFAEAVAQAVRATLDGSPATEIAPPAPVLVRRDSA